MTKMLEKQIIEKSITLDSKSLEENAVFSITFIQMVLYLVHLEAKIRPTTL